MVSRAASGAVGVTRSEVADVVLRCLRAVAPGTEPAMDMPFTGYGVNSLGVARLRLEIESELRVELSLETLANCRCATTLSTASWRPPRGDRGRGDGQGRGAARSGPPIRAVSADPAAGGVRGRQAVRRTRRGRRPRVPGVRAAVRRRRAAARRVAAVVERP